MGPPHLHRLFSPPPHLGLARSLQTRKARELRDDVPGTRGDRFHREMGKVGTSPGKNWGNLSKKLRQCVKNNEKINGKYGKNMENMEKSWTNHGQQMEHMPNKVGKMKQIISFGYHRT